MAVGPARFGSARLGAAALALVALWVAAYWWTPSPRRDGAIAFAPGPDTAQPDSFAARSLEDIAGVAPAPETEAAPGPRPVVLRALPDAKPPDGSASGQALTPALDRAPAIGPVTRAPTTRTEPAPGASASAPAPSPGAMGAPGSKAPAAATGERAGPSQAAPGPAVPGAPEDRPSKTQGQSSAPGSVVPPAFVEYTIAKGDTAGTISQRFYGTPGHWRQIMRSNPRTDFQHLKVGQKIRVPKDPQNIQGKATPAPARAGNDGKAQQPSTPPQPKPGQAIEYTVASGETLSEIAQRVYGTSSLWTLIRDANRAKVGKDGRNLQAGMVLTIPPKPRGER